MNLSKPDILCTYKKLFIFVVVVGSVCGGGDDHHYLDEGHKTGMCMSSETRETLR